MRLGKETLDALPSMSSCYKSHALPLGNFDAFDKTLRALRRARLAGCEALCFVNSGVFSQTLFHKDWVSVRVGFCVLVIEGSRTVEDWKSSEHRRLLEGWNWDGAQIQGESLTRFSLVVIVSRFYWFGDCNLYKPCVYYWLQDSEILSTGRVPPDVGVLHRTG